MSVDLPAARRRRTGVWSACTSVGARLTRFGIWFGARFGAQSSRSQLIAWYAIFAAISIGTNLASQKLAFWMYQGNLAVPISVCIGTAVGLAVKYALDKAWIFRYPNRSVAHGIRTFALYVAMGLGTTLIFWSAEFGADALLHSEPARLVGGAIGLTLGYVVKYALDRRFVFA